MKIDTLYYVRVKKDLDDVVSRLRPGDIILMGSRLHPFSLLIEWITASSYSHAEMYIGNGKCIGARFKGIVIKSLSYYAKWYRHFMVVRPTKATATEAVCVQAAEYAVSLEGDGYDFLHLFQYLWRLLLGTLGKAPIADDPGRFVCHEFVAHCYHKLGVKIGGKYPDNTTGRSLYLDRQLDLVFV